MKGIRKRVAVVLAVVVLSLTVQPFYGDTVQAEEERVYCTEYEVCRERQIGELYFDNIEVYRHKVSSLDGNISVESDIRCNVTNLSEEEIFQGEQYVEMTFFKDGREIDALEIGCGQLRPGETGGIGYGILGDSIDLTEADFMAIRIYGKQNGGEIVSIDGPEFKKSRLVEKVLILNNFELHKVRQDCWRFRGRATAIKNMYAPCKITFTFTGEDNRTEQYSTEVQLDQSFSTEYETDFGDMSWVKDMEVSYEMGTPEPIVLKADDIEEMIPSAGAKFIDFEITGIDGAEKYWYIVPQYIHCDGRYQILQVYYEILDKNENVLVSYSKDFYSQYGVTPGLSAIQTNAHMERAVRVRAYITTRPFYPLEDDSSTVEEEEGREYCAKYGVCRERQIEELYFHKIKLWWDGDQSHFTCDVTNLSEDQTASGEDYVTLGFYKNGKEMITMPASHLNIPPGEKRTMSTEVQDLNLTEADFMVMGIRGRYEGSEIVSVEEQDLWLGYYTGDVLLDNFELRRIKWDRWTFKGKATATRNMSLPYKITFTFTGEDDRSEQYTTEIQLDEDDSTEYGADFGDMSWVKHMKISYEEGTPETGDLDAVTPGPTGKDPEPVATQPPENKPKQTPGYEPTGSPPSNVGEQTWGGSEATPVPSHPSIGTKEEKAVAVSLKISKNAKGLPILTLKGKETSGKYQIYRSLKKGSGYKKIAEISSSRYTDKEVKGGGVYYYKVRQVIRADGKMKQGPFTRGVRITVQEQNIPQFRVQSRRYSAKLNYAEVQLKRYQGDYVQIFYRKPGEKFKSIKLKQNRISKKKIFRISYERKISGIYIKVRTYRIQNGKKQYSDFSKTIKVS